MTLGRIAPSISSTLRRALAYAMAVLGAAFIANTAQAACDEKTALGVERIVEIDSKDGRSWGMSNTRTSTFSNRARWC